MGVLWLLGLHALISLAQPYQNTPYQTTQPYQNTQQGGYLNPQPQQFISPQFLSASPQWGADRPRSIFDLDLKSSLGGPFSSQSRTLAPLTNIDTAANAIFPLTDITAEPTQTAKNSEQTISIYQDTLTKMYREVSAQKDNIKKSDETIQKLQQIQANNKKILEKNMATVKKYSAGLVTIVTQYTESLDMAAGGGASSSTPSTDKAKDKAKEKAGDDDKKDQDKKDQDKKDQGKKDQDGDADATKSFMEKLAQLKKHAVIGLNI